MACGPVTGSESKAGQGVGIDPFSFSQEMMMTAGFGAVAAMWAAPLRAAMVVADEAMRESLGPWG